jgi:hypothetical protein
MITIFCDFRQFSAKKWRFSQKPMLWSKLSIIYLCFESETQIFFAEFFGENILKIITSVPDEFEKKSPKMCSSPFWSISMHYFYHGKNGQNFGHFYNPIWLP